MNGAPRVLLIGYGNPARGDDGLGPAVAQAIAARELDGVTAEWPYQLQVEDAATIASTDFVVFVDASLDCNSPFCCRAIAPEGEPSWTTHSLRPGAALALARDVFGTRTPAALLAVRGYEFDAFREGLSSGASANLAAALAWLEPRLETRNHELLSLLAPATIEG